MTTAGATSIPPQITQLQPHICTIINSIQALLLRKSNITLSPGTLTLMRNFLNENALHFLHDMENYLYKLSDNEFDTELTQFDKSKDDTHLVCLVATFKYFYLYVKKIQTDSDINDIFDSEANIFFAFVIASLLASKMIYDEIEPSTYNIHEVFEILYKNIINRVFRLFNEQSSLNSDYWESNKDDAYLLLNVLRNYESYQPDAHLAFITIIDLLDEPQKSELTSLYSQLDILTKCKHLFDDPTFSDDDSNYQNDNFSSEESSSETNSELDDVFHLYVFERDFLKTLDNHCYLCFTLMQTYQLLYDAEQFVNHPAEQLAKFTLQLDSFGKFNHYPAIQTEDLVVPPCSPSLLVRFQDALRNNKTMPLRRVSTEVKERTNLRSLSY